MYAIQSLLDFKGLMNVFSKRKNKKEGVLLRPIVWFSIWPETLGSQIQL